MLLYIAGNILSCGTHAASCRLAKYHTYFMVQSPSWKAKWFAASQEIPRISRNPKVHYRTHKCPPPVSILGQPNPVHIPTSHLLEIHPNIHASMPRSPQWSLSLLFPHQEPIHPPLLTHTRHMPSLIQSIYPHPTSWRSILISTHLCLGLPSGLFPSRFPTKTLYTPYYI